jgi:flagellar export protein FliJ
VFPNELIVYRIVVVPRQKYRLQPVLEVRDQIKQAAARLVATRRDQLAQAEAELARRTQAVVDCRNQQVAAQQKLFAESEAGVEANLLVIHRTHLADLRRIEQELIAQVEEQRVVVSTAKDEVDKAITALIEASREVQVIEKHREGWQERTRREEQLREQKTSDEIGALAHRQKHEE